MYEGELISKYDTFYSESYKDLARLKKSKSYELFISAFTKETMIKDVYDSIDSKKKYGSYFRTMFF